MADQIQFELVSPERLLISEPVEMVVVPGVEGDFGVLPGHAPLVSTVRPAPSGMPNQPEGVVRTLVGFVNASSVTIPRLTVGSVEGLAAVGLNILPT